MTFVIKGGGGLKSAIRAKIYFKNHLESVSDCQNVFLQIVLALYYICIVVEMTYGLICNIAPSWQSAVGAA